MQSHKLKVHACLAVTCHLHFWKNNWALLRATAVTREWNRYRNKSQHRDLTLEKKILPPLLQGLKPTTHNLSIISPALKPLSYPCSPAILPLSSRNHKYCGSRTWITYAWNWEPMLLVAIDVPKPKPLHWTRGANEHLTPI